MATADPNVVEFAWNDDTSDLLTVSYYGTAGDSDLSVTSVPNLTENIRQRTVTVKQVNNTASKQVTIVQFPKPPEAILDMMDLIADYGLNAYFDGNAVQITGEKTNANTTLELNIPDDITVVWNALLQGAVAGTSSLRGLLNLGASKGTFIINGGSIENTYALSSGFAATIYGGTVLAKTGNAVNAGPSYGLAIGGDAVLFAHGTTLMGDVINGTAFALSSLADNAVIIAWDKEAGSNLYEQHAGKDLVFSPSAAIRKCARPLHKGSRICVFANKIGTILF